MKTTMAGMIISLGTKVILASCLDHTISRPAPTIFAITTVHIRLKVM